MLETTPPLPEAVAAVVMTGTRLPIRILAFSLLRARIRGLASTLLLPVVASASTVTLKGETVTVEPLMFEVVELLKSLSTRFCGVSSVAELG